MHSSLKPHGQRVSRRRMSLVAATIATLALPASALAAAKFKLTPHIANHTPTINKEWPITIYVTRGSTKLSGSVKYEFLFQGQVVSHQPGKKFTNGVYKDELDFPSDSLGQPLTLRILVTVPKYGTEHLDWTIKSQK
jgi:hypothetical protein